MVTNGQNVVVDVLENGIGDIAVGSCRITQSGAIVEVLLPD